MVQQPSHGDKHACLHGIVDLVVQRVDAQPERVQAEHVARNQAGAYDVRGPRIGFFLHAVDKGGADAVDQRVGEVRGEDLPAQRMAQHGVGVPLAQRCGK